jgi:hypothetical protein
MVKKVSIFSFISIVFIVTLINFNKQDKNVLGISEIAELQSTGIKYDAKVDSGAETSSLHATNIKVFQNDMVSFITENEKGQSITLTKHIEFKKVIKSASGQKERIFIKEIIRIGNNTYQIFINLADRTNLSKKMLIGKDIIKQGFLIDANKKYLISANSVK